jgi:hypothetical protein
MCFSAEASITAGVVLTAAGAASVGLAGSRREVPLAAIPLVFGVHQLVEGVVWHQVDDAGGGPVRTGAVVVWLFIAWTLWPAYVPWAASCVEPDPGRRRLMRLAAGAGAVLGVVLLVASVVDATTATAAHGHIDYSFPLPGGEILGVVYVAVTCGSLLVSSRRFLRLFAVALAAAMVVTLLLDALAFSSLWCYLAAVLSAGIVVHYLRPRMGWGAAPLGSQV